jgi:hypothetical protein
MFERLENLIPDMINKNLPEQDHQRHARNLRQGSMIIWREDVEGDSHKLGFVQTNQDPIGVKSRVKAKKFVRQGNVNVLQSSKNVHKPRSVTWKEPVSDLRHKEKSEDQGWITVSRRRSVTKKGEV